MRLARRWNWLDGGSINQAPVEPFIGHLGRFRERLEDVSTARNMHFYDKQLWSLKELNSS
jgi:hypothetical protein